MCGIIGYSGGRQATPLLVGGLRKLEYRGYDSAGVSVYNNGTSRVVRCRGKLSNLEEKLLKEPAPGTVGIGHTRWATHGRPSDENSHPHKVGPISVIHNGIIENHLQLRAELAASGAKFSSETDTEIFAHLVERELALGAENLTAAVRRSLAKVRGSVFIACGTSYHASMVGEFLVESLARIPTEVDLASEFRYRDPILGPGGLVIAVSQSGETLDTMEAVREAKKKGAQVLAISNVLESSIPRLADYAFYTHAGPEIGVASTKAFTTQLVAMTLLAIYLGRRTKALTKERARALLAELVQLPLLLCVVV